MIRLNVAFLEALLVSCLLFIVYCMFIIRAQISIICIVNKEKLLIVIIMQNHCDNFTCIHKNAQLISLLFVAYFYYKGSPTLLQSINFNVAHYITFAHQYRTPQRNAKILLKIHKYINKYLNTIIAVVFRGFTRPTHALN